ncbi:MAG: hypothetical protein A2W00_06160 [Candidatus Eisenbacteria bacterium RBG_16_71_46]|nr:MAG: hypothetical protein A2W00_06160 [Candidatus Eisenbacteria bacterium RBG_16_71_46]OGF24858.1 MAG: hypothetical protein A2V63_04145 [Candidatus Eisenbacteria bacterium RBG_19FT_COMBO_70_11]
MERKDEFTRRAFLATLSGAALAGAALAALGRRARGAPAPGAPGWDLRVRGNSPEQWESSLEGLDHSWITRNDRFFVRNHLPAPQVDAASYRLEVAGLVRRPLSMSLAEIQALPAREAAHTLECAGNGRAYFRPFIPTGTLWERGAVGNASWRGCPLSVLLERAQVLPEARHVWFEAADEAPKGEPRFLRSIPIQKAMAGTLLAYAMNEEPLPALHGGPLRAVVPGWYAMASTKWVTRVRVEPVPSDNRYMVGDYRYFREAETGFAAPPVEELQVKSVITRPLEGAVVPVGKLRVQGFAWAGDAGARLVEISIDGGATWRPAGFMGTNTAYAWRTWATMVDVPEPARLTVMARATDGNGAQQPLYARYNALGYANNAIHSVTVDIQE